MLTLAKVFISLLLQLSLAIIFYVLLLGLEWWPSTRGRKAEKLSLALSVALIEFHKNQCYFISAIEIAALVLDSQAYIAFTQDTTPPVFDIFLALPLSMNSFIPIVFSLSCIARYGRLSWHIIILSLIAIALSTGPLAASYMWILRISSAFGPDLLSVNNAGGDYPDGLATAKIVCGSQSTFLEHSIDRTNIKFSLIWLTYTYCIAWGAWCLGKHVFISPPRGSRRERALEAWHNSMLNSATSKLPPWAIFVLRYPLFILIWTLCFIYHIYLYSLFTRSSLVSPEWTFGQIVAVTVWVPSVVEFLDIEYRKLIRFDQ